MDWNISQWTIRQRVLSGFIGIASLIAVVGYFSVSLTKQVQGLRMVELPMEQNLREVEVSVWEAIHAANAFLLGGDEYFEKLYYRQIEDVNKFFPQYVAATDTPEEREYIKEFEKLWQDAQEAGKKMIEYTKKQEEQEKTFFVNVDKADDVLDYELQSEWAKNDPHLLAKEQAVREVEVSLWEAIHAAHQYLGHIEEIIMADGKRVKFNELMEKQFDDVAEFWPKYKALAKTTWENKAIAKFDKLWNAGIVSGNEMIKYRDLAKEQFDTLYKKVDAADDVIDHKIQKYIASRIDKEDQIAASTRRNAIIFVLFAFVLAVSIGLFIARSVANPLRLAGTQISSSAMQYKASAEQAASGAAEQSSTVNEVTSSIQELAVTAEQISKNAKNMTDAAEKTMAEMKATQEKVLKTSSKILALGEKSQTIGNIIKMIDSLAEQTNLLAINAAIESSRAGEAGKGFSVVAGEIRKLSERSRESLEEIRSIISEIQAETNASVMGVEESSKQMEKGMELIGKTTQQIKEISMATRQQRSSSEQVVNAIKGIGTTATQFQENTKKTAAATKQLDELSEKLSKMIGVTKVEKEAA